MNQGLPSRLVIHHVVANRLRHTRYSNGTVASSSKRHLSKTPPTYPRPARLLHWGVSSWWRSGSPHIRVGGLGCGWNICSREADTLAVMWMGQAGSRSQVVSDATPLRNLPPISVTVRRTALHTSKILDFAVESSGLTVGRGMGRAAWPPPRRREWVGVHCTLPPH